MTGESIVASFLAGRPVRTRAVYSAALAHFAAWIGAPDTAAAVAQLLAGGGAAARVLAVRFRDSSLRGGSAPRSVALRLAALRSLVRTARDLGAVTWALEVDGPVATPTAPDVVIDDAAFRRVLRAAVPRSGVRPAHRRDAALLRLLRVLTRAEACALDVGDIDLAGAAVRVALRGSGRRTGVPIDDDTAAALAAWLSVRGAEPGPLFVRELPGRFGGRLTANGAWRIARRVGAAAGFPDLRPDQLRRRRRVAGGIAAALAS